MNFVKTILYVHLVLMSNLACGSDFLNTLGNIASVKVGFEDNKFFIAAEEKPSFWRRMVGMNGEQHRIETPALPNLFETEERSYCSSSRSQSELFDRKKSNCANNSESIERYNSVYKSRLELIEKSQSERSLDCEPIGRSYRSQELSIQKINVNDLQNKLKKTTPQEEIKKERFIKKEYIYGGCAVIIAVCCYKYLKK